MFWWRKHSVRKVTGLEVVQLVSDSAEIIKTQSPACQPSALLLDLLEQAGKMTSPRDKQARGRGHRVKLQGLVKDWTLRAREKGNGVAYVKYKNIIWGWAIPKSSTGLHSISQSQQTRQQTQITCLLHIEKLSLQYLNFTLKISKGIPSQDVTGYFIAGDDCHQPSAPCCDQQTKIRSMTRPFTNGLRSDCRSARK